MIIAIKIGKELCRVDWKSFPEYVSLYPHKDKVHSKIPFRVINTTCMISTLKSENLFTEGKYETTMGVGTAICSPKDKYSSTFGIRLSFMRALDNYLSYYMPGTKEINKKVRRDIKKDILQGIYKDGFGKILGLRTK